MVEFYCKLPMVRKDTNFGKIPPEKILVRQLFK